MSTSDAEMDEAPRVPEYCFLSTPTHQDPAWCLETNDSYVDLCAKVDRITDTHATPMYQLPAWPPAPTDSDKQEVKVAIDLEESRVTINQLTIGSVNIRYCYMLQASSSPGDTEASPPTHVLVVSYWDGTYTGRMANLLLTADNEHATVCVMNLLRKMVGNLSRLKWFKPLMVGPLAVLKGRDEYMRLEDIPSDQFEVSMVTVDEEVICFCPGTQLRGGVDGGSSVHTLRFTTDQKDDTIEKIYAHTVLKLVEIETATQKYIFKGQDDSVYKQFAFYVQGRIRAKIGTIFDFSTPERFAAQMDQYPTETYQESQPLYIPVVMPKKTSQRAHSGQADEASGSRPDSGRSESPPMFRQSFPETPRRGDRRGDASHAEDTEKVQMDILIASLKSCTESLGAISEEIQVMWCVLEDEAGQLIKDGLVPESAVDSGGLDPNSSDHLSRAIKSIQDALFDNKIDRALSQLQGVKKVFCASRYSSVKDWFKTGDEKEMLKQIYFAGGSN